MLKSIVTLIFTLIFSPPLSNSIHPIFFLFAFISFSSFSFNYYASLNFFSLSETYLTYCWKFFINQYIFVSSYFSCIIHLSGFSNLWLTNTIFLRSFPIKHDYSHRNTLHCMPNLKLIIWPEFQRLPSTT